MFISSQIIFRNFELRKTLFRWAFSYSKLKKEQDAGLALPECHAPGLVIEILSAEVGSAVRRFLHGKGHGINPALARLAGVNAFGQ